MGTQVVYVCICGDTSQLKTEAKDEFFAVRCTNDRTWLCAEANDPHFPVSEIDKEQMRDVRERANGRGFGRAKGRVVKLLCDRDELPQRLSVQPP